MPEQVILEGTMTVGPTAQGFFALAIQTGGERTYLIPLPDETRKTIGEALLAPHVAVPQAPPAANGGR